MTACNCRTILAKLQSRRRRLVRHLWIEVKRKRRIFARSSFSLAARATLRSQHAPFHESQNPALRRGLVLDCSATDREVYAAVIDHYQASTAALRRRLTKQKTYHSTCRCSDPHHDACSRWRLHSKFSHKLVCRTSWQYPE